MTRKMGQMLTEEELYKRASSVLKTNDRLLIEFRKPFLLLYGRFRDNITCFDCVLFKMSLSTPFLSRMYFSCVFSESVTKNIQDACCFKFSFQQILGILKYCG